MQVFLNVLLLPPWHDQTVLLLRSFASYSYPLHTFSSVRWFLTMGVNDANMDLFSCNSTTVAWKLETAFISLAFSLIFLVGTVGNCLVLAVLFRTGKMNTKTTSLFIFNLGIADLSFIVFCVTGRCPRHKKVLNLRKDLFCKVSSPTFCLFTSVYASFLFYLDD